MNNKTTTESATKMGEQQTANDLQLLLYRAPKKNNEAIAKNLTQFVPWFKEHGAKVEYSELDKSDTQSVIHSAKENGTDVLDSIAKILSTPAEDDEEEVWMEGHYFRGHKHCEEIYSKLIMQDKGIEPRGNEFFRLVAQGKMRIIGGFNPLRE